MRAKKASTKKAGKRAPQSDGDFSKVVKTIIAQRAGYKCSKPGCPKVLTGPHDESSKSVVTGEAAHICAARPGKARYDPDMTSEQRASPDNGIWLCREHHKDIDDAPGAYPVSMLVGWKQAAEDAAKAAREGKPAAPADNRHEYEREKAAAEEALEYHQSGLKTGLRLTQEIFDQIRAKHGLSPRPLVWRQPYRSLKNLPPA